MNASWDQFEKCLPSWEWLPDRTGRAPFVAELAKQLDINTRVSCKETFWPRWRGHVELGLKREREEAGRVLEEIYAQEDDHNSFVKRHRAALAKLCVDKDSLYALYFMAQVSHPAIEKLMRGVPTFKTISLDEMKVHVRYVVEHLDQLLDFFNRMRDPRFKRQLLRYKKSTRSPTA